MNVQNAKELTIEEGDVRTIHDSDGKQLWGKLAYSTTYTGDTSQTGTPSPDNPVPISVVQGTQTITLTDGVVSDDFTVGLTGKNLFDGIMEQGSFDNNGINSSSDFRIRSKNYIPVAPSTSYTITVGNWDTGKGAVCGISVSYYNKNDYTTSRLSSTSWTSIGQGFTFTTPANCYYVRFLLTIGATAGANNTIRPTDVSDIQAETGSVPSAYVPYYNIELAKIGTYQDYIYKSGDDWYVHKATNKIILSQSSDVTNRPGGQVNDESALFYCTPVNDGLSRQMETTSYTLSDHFVPASVYGSSITINGYFIASNHTIAIRARGDSLGVSPTLENFKSWITQNPVTIYYALETPTDTKITDTTLIGQLDAIHEWLTRYGYTATVVGNLPIVITQTNL